MDEELRTYLERMRADLAGKIDRAAEATVYLNALRNDIAAIENRITVRMDERLASLEDRLADRIMERVGGRIDAAEDRLKAHVGQSCEKVETKLLRAFHSWSRSMEVRVRGASVSVAGFDERLSLAEERIGELERGRQAS